MNCKLGSTTHGAKSREANTRSDLTIYCPTKLASVMARICLARVTAILVIIVAFSAAKTSEELEDEELAVLEDKMTAVSRRRQVQPLIYRIDEQVRVSAVLG